MGTTTITRTIIIVPTARRRRRSWSASWRTRARSRRALRPITMAPRPTSWQAPAAGSAAPERDLCGGTAAVLSAILVLVFALAQGMFWAGIAATFLMGLGTAIAVAAIAILAVTAKGAGAAGPAPAARAAARCFCAASSLVQRRWCCCSASACCSVMSQPSGSRAFDGVLVVRGCGGGSLRSIPGPRFLTSSNSARDAIAIMTTVVSIDAHRPVTAPARERVGVLLVNLGTPDTADADRRAGLSPGVPVRSPRDREPGPALEAGPQRHHPAHRGRGARRATTRRSGTPRRTSRR